MHVYTLNVPVADTKIKSALFKELRDIEPLRHHELFMIVGPYRYGYRGTHAIPDAVWNDYRAFTKIHKLLGKHWELEIRSHIVGEKWAQPVSRIITLKLHEPDFPLDFMLRASPDIRRCLKLERAT
jgi:hypothetical protein